MIKFSFVGHALVFSLDSDSFFADHDIFRLTINDRPVINCLFSKLRDKTPLSFDFTYHYQYLPVDSIFELYLNNNLLYSLAVKGASDSQYFLTEHDEPILISGKTFNTFIPLGDYSEFRLNELRQFVELFFSACRNEGILASVNGGSLLGYKREGALIPHDDDFDVCVVVESSASFIDAMCKFRSLVLRLQQHGIKTQFLTNGQCHLMCDLYSSSVIDVFVGWFNADLFSLNWAFMNSLAKKDVLPLREIDFLNLKGAVAFFDSEAILSEIYGKNWKTPDPFWRIDYPKSLRNRFSLMAAHDCFDQKVLNEDCFLVRHGIKDSFLHKYNNISLDIEDSSESNLSGFIQDDVFADSVLRISLTKFDFVHADFLCALDKKLQSSGAVISISTNYSIFKSNLALQSALFELASAVKVRDIGVVFDVIIIDGPLFSDLSLDGY